MPLRQKLQNEAETVGGLMVCAEEKYWEGLELMAAQKWGAGIYLMGYAAEMYLKTACFLVDGAKPVDLVRSMLGSAETRGKLALPGISHESYHSLDFWAALLTFDRNRMGLAPWTPVFTREFTSHVATLYSIWWVSMRYRPDRAGSADGHQVFDSATWLRASHASLRR